MSCSSCTFFLRYGNFGQSFLGDSRQIFGGFVLILNSGSELDLIAAVWIFTDELLKISLTLNVPI